MNILVWITKVAQTQGKKQARGFGVENWVKFIMLESERNLFIWFTSNSEPQVEGNNISEMKYSIEDDYINNTEYNERVTHLLDWD